MTEVEPNHLASRLAGWRDGARTGAERLAVLRQRAEDATRRLESPQAVLEFVDFFAGFFTEAAAVLERVRGELDPAPRREHPGVLRQLASNGAVEQRRCLKFRDKWINRPLPYEDVRPLLTEISALVAERLAALGDLNAAAEELDALTGPMAPPRPDDKRPLDRRQLFTKWFGK